VVAGLLDVAFGNATHSDSGGDDDIGELREQVIASSADALSGIETAQAYKRLRGFADLLGELEDPRLDRNIAVVGVQAADRIPHDPSGIDGASLAR
jgi:hypothetical protein